MSYRNHSHSSWFHKPNIKTRTSQAEVSVLTDRLRTQHPHWDSHQRRRQGKPDLPSRTSPCDDHGLPKILILRHGLYKDFHSVLASYSEPAVVFGMTSIRDGFPVSQFDELPPTAHSGNARMSPSIIISQLCHNLGVATSNISGLICTLNRSWSGRDSAGTWTHCFLRWKGELFAKRPWLYTWKRCGIVKTIQVTFHICTAQLSIILLHMDK